MHLTPKERAIARHLGLSDQVMTRHGIASALLNKMTDGVITDKELRGLLGITAGEAAPRPERSEIEKALIKRFKLAEDATADEILTAMMKASDAAAERSDPTRGLRSSTGNTEETPGGLGVRGDAPIPQSPDRTTPGNLDAVFSKRTWEIMALPGFKGMANQNSALRLAQCRAREELNAAVVMPHTHPGSER